MQSHPISEDGTVLPEHLQSKVPAFETERFRILPLNPGQARQLVEELLQDARLAEYVSWMADKSRDGAHREAFLLQMQCAAGTVLVWGIVERGNDKFIGALLARPTIEGLDLEVLCQPSMWEQKVTEEAAFPVAEWIQDHCEVQTVKAN
ncbi:GNAT family N-acetyltransferase [Paraburkholderia sp. CI3]|uniref:GNAT family N-acetyltransferase n=1 Tax=Paraburkholderia sp. CI3 TaxID=2991060 RepID=UPI003D201915